MKEKTVFATPTGTYAPKKTFFNLFFAVLLFAIFFNFPISWAQRQCGSHLHHSKGHIGKPALEQLIQQKIQDNQATERTGRLQREEYNFPVIVHVLHLGESVGEGTNISAAQIYSQFEVLEEDFNLKNSNLESTVPAFKSLATSAGFHFKPATVSPDGTPLIEKGINRIQYSSNRFTMAELENSIKPATIWDPKRYINVWVCDMGNVNLVGYAQFPFAPSLPGLDEEDPANTDGIVMSYTNIGSLDKVRTPQLLEGGNLNLGRTLTHELGHFLGLIHIWGDVINCETTTDYCADTPPQRKANYGCELANTSCTSLDMAQNFMDYTDDRCMTLFTKDQVERMRAALAVAARRLELTTSNTANPVDKGIFANFVASSKRICAGQEVRFTDKSMAFGSSSITSYRWTFEGGSPATSTEKNPKVVYNTAGLFAVRLEVSGGTESNTLNLNNFVSVESTMGAATTLSKDFEDNSLTSAGWEASENSWKVTSLGSGASKRSVLHIDNYSMNLQGRLCQYTSPLLDTRGQTLMRLSFDYAYSTREGQYDSLLIFYSTDCGGTFKPIFRHGGWDLSTSITRNTLFRATNEADWKNVQLLIPVEGTESLKIRFINISARGNALYLDNINLNAPSFTSKPILTDFQADYQTIVEKETLKYRFIGQDFASYEWMLSGAKVLQTDPFLTKTWYDNVGKYEAALALRNSKGEAKKTESGYISVLDAMRVNNNSSSKQSLRETSNGFIAGTNTAADKAKAEYFKLQGLSVVYGFDVRFAHVFTNNPNKMLLLKVWATDASGKPAEVLYSMEVSYQTATNYAKRGLPLRCILPSPMPINTGFFIGFELDEDNTHQLAVFSSEAADGKNTAWELTKKGTWQPFSKSVGENGRGVDVALGIWAITNKGVVSATNERRENAEALLYPNPASDLVFLKTEGAETGIWALANLQGQIVRTGTTWPLSVAGLAEGLYMLRVDTASGFFVKKLLVKP